MDFLPLSMRRRFIRMNDSYWVEPENLQKRVKRFGFSLLTTVAMVVFLSGRDAEVFAPFVIYWLAYESITTALELSRKSLVWLVPLLRVIAITLPIVFLFIERFRVVGEFDSQLLLNALDYSQLGVGGFLLAIVFLYFLSEVASKAMTTLSPTVFGREKVFMVAGGFVLAMMFYLPDREIGGFVTALDAYSDNSNSPYNSLGNYGFWWVILIAGYVESLWKRGVGLGRIND